MNEEIKDAAITLLQTLVNATGAEFENEKLAVDIMAKTITEAVKNNAVLPIVSTRTWEFSYDEDFTDIEMTLDVPNDKDPYDILLEHVPDDIATTLWYRAI